MKGIITALLIIILTIISTHYLYSTLDDGRGEYFVQEELVKVIESFEYGDNGISNMPVFYGVNEYGEVFKVSPICEAGDIVNRPYYDGGGDQGWKILIGLTIFILYIILFVGFSIFMDESKKIVNIYGITWSNWWKIIKLKKSK